MQIDHQTAQGDIHNIGTLYYEESPETLAIIKQDKQRKLQALNSVSYLELLRTDYSKRKHLERQLEIIAIDECLNKHKQILFWGEPGLGKTTLILEFAKENEEIIYISAKGKSPFSIISYLTNKELQKQNKELIEFKDINEAIGWFEATPKNSKTIFIIDDSEQNIEIIKKIIFIEKFDTKFLLVSRNYLIFEKTGIKDYHCKPLTENEVKAYILQKSINLDTLKFNELYIKSKGNPLYLFYYSNFPTDSILDNLDAYQKSILDNLTSQQIELLSYISISNYPSTINEIEEITKRNLMEVVDDIDTLSSIVNNNSGVLNIFHPSFREFIQAYLKKKGIYTTHKEKLGDYYLSKRDYLQAVYLLIDINPDKIQEYLLAVHQTLIEWGEFQFAENVLLTKLKYVKDKFITGYIYYHLCEINFTYGNKEKAKIYIDKAIENLQNIKKGGIYDAARMYKAMLLVDEGFLDDAKKISNEVFRELNNTKSIKKAILLISLSTIFIHTSEFAKGAKICKEAYEIFENKGMTDGMINSLVNLVSCLGQMDDCLDDAQKYALSALDKIEKTENFRAKIVCLNALSSIYRRRENFEKAINYSEQAIKLCQEYGMKDKAVLNLINYGNIIRDTGNILKAISTYEEALVYTKEYKLIKDEGRIYWILSDIYKGYKDFIKSLKYANKSIECHTKINYFYGIAYAFEKKAEILEAV